MMLDTRRKLAPFLPHSHAMLLLERVTEYGAEHIIAESDIGPHQPFFEAGRVPAYLAIEIMAQSIAAWSGLRRGDPDSPPPLGYLLGTRNFHSGHSHFHDGETLVVHSRRMMEFDGLASFSCSLSVMREGRIESDVAQANISVYSSDDPAPAERS
jgi:predicted hotdog family 3-hydroxylacyl-ACP dehydratase